MRDISSLREWGQSVVEDTFLSELEDLKANLHFQWGPTVDSETDPVAVNGQNQRVPLVIVQVSALELAVLDCPSIASIKEMQAVP